MKKKKLKKRIIYQSDTDMIRRTVQEISRIAGRNLMLYRCHCHLTQREVYYQTGINYPLISNYEKEIKNMCVYSFLITFYRDTCRYLEIGDPEGIVQISNKLLEILF